MTQIRDFGPMTQIPYFGPNGFPKTIVLILLLSLLYLFILVLYFYTFQYVSNGFGLTFSIFFQWFWGKMFEHFSTNGFEELFNMFPMVLGSIFQYVSNGLGVKIPTCVQWLWGQIFNIFCNGVGVSFSICSNGFGIKK